MIDRRRFVPLGTTSGNPTIEAAGFESPGRRHFRQLSSGIPRPFLPVVLSDWQRQYVLQSVLSTDGNLPQYSTPWVYTQINGTPVYRLLITGAPTIPAGVPPQRHENDRWIRYMRPIRYRIYGPPVATTNNELFKRGYLVAQSNETPPIEGHFKQSRNNLLTMRPAFATQMFVQETKVAYFRVLKNGVAITGIEETEGKLWDIVNATNYRTSTMIEMALPSMVSAGDVVDVDCWLYVSFTRREAGTIAPDNLNPFTLPWHYLTYITMPGGTQANLLPYNMLFNGIDCNARVKPVDVFQITWGSNSPGGTNPLTLEAQAGWLFTQVSTTSVLMTKTSAPSSGETVFFNWGREVPEIIVTRNVTMPPGLGPRVRLIPVDSGHYNQSMIGFTEGIWQPASTDFRAMSFITADGSLYAPAYVNMPSTCTIARV